MAKRNDKDVRLSYQRPNYKRHSRVPDFTEKLMDRPGRELEQERKTGQQIGDRRDTELKAVQHGVDVRVKRWYLAGKTANEKDDN